MRTLHEREVLPAAIKQRAEAIVREAHISSKTLYRSENLALWHPEHCLVIRGPEEMCKPVESAGVSGLQEGGATGEGRFPSGNASRTLKQPHSQEVYTSGKSMKCELFEAALAKSNSLNRGVRGDELRFPQVSEP